MGSRQLDALVAEKVMGQSVGSDCDHSYGTCLCFPCYSADISAAWQVLEKLRERFEAVAVVSDAQTGPGADPSKGWVCFGQRPHFQADGVTAPEAICRAALQAVEALVPA